WGTNYIYGTWSVLMALAQAHIGADDPAVRRAVQWFKRKRNTDGGWGESNDSYAQARGEAGQFPRTAYQTAGALLGLPAARERPQLHGARLSACVLFEISRLFGVFPVVGAGGLPHIDAARNRSLTRMGVVAPLESEAGPLGPVVRRRDGLSALGNGAFLAVSGMG